MRQMGKREKEDDDSFLASTHSKQTEKVPYSERPKAGDKKEWCGRLWKRDGQDIDANSPQKFILQYKMMGKK